MIQKIWIKHVRNLNDVSIDLLKKKHCYIYGDNNQGKTSILLSFGALLIPMFGTSIEHLSESTENL